MSLQTSDRLLPRDNLDVRWQTFRGALHALGGSENIFWNLFGISGASDTFWLDRSVFMTHASEALGACPKVLNVAASY